MQRNGRTPADGWAVPARPERASGLGRLGRGVGAVPQPDLQVQPLSVVLLLRPSVGTGHGVSQRACSAHLEREERGQPLTRLSVCCTHLYLY